MHTRIDWAYVDWFELSPKIFLKRICIKWSYYLKPEILDKNENVSTTEIISQCVISQHS